MFQKKFACSDIFFISLIFSFLLFMGCAGDPSPKESEKSAQAVDSVKVFSLSGNYSFLYISKKEFEGLPKRGTNPNSPTAPLMLKNVITDSGLSLHGWSQKGLPKDDFDSLPSIMFHVGKDTTLTFQSGSYFSDFIIGQKALKRIEDSLSKYPLYNFIALIPKFKGKDYYQIYYSVRLYDTEPLTLSQTTLNFMDIGEEFNPIPPKGTGDLE